LRAKLNSFETGTPIVYASFDRFPSAKGAATHIDAFIRALGSEFGDVHLLTVPSELREIISRASANRFAPNISDDAEWSAKGVMHHPMLSRGAHLFERVDCFRTHCRVWWNTFLERSQKLPIVHVRSIFEGYPIAKRKEYFCRKLIYEVNGLPSIELKYRYPAVADDPELVRKLTWQEQVCLDAADMIITVSEVNARCLVERGVERSRIRIIANGVDEELFRFGAPRPLTPEAVTIEQPLSLLYAGTMSAWQGVPVAIDALRLLRRDFPACLKLVGTVRPRQRRELESLIYNLGLSDAVEILDPVPKVELAKLHRQADVILAPLTRNDRNLVQGCCPLKVIEGMASGTPVVASDLPVVRELMQPDVEGILVRAGSAKAIKDGILRLIREEGFSRQLSCAARSRVEREFTWKQSQAKLIQVYRELLDFEVDSFIK
jgi:glycosyltransferase involved in cell wall biosynthesis